MQAATANAIDKLGRAYSHENEVANKVPMMLISRAARVTPISARALIRLPSSGNRPSNVGMASVHTRQRATTISALRIYAGANQINRARFGALTGENHAQTEEHHEPEQRATQPSGPAVEVLSGLEHLASGAMPFVRHGDSVSQGTLRRHQLAFGHGGDWTTDMV